VPPKAIQRANKMDERQFAAELEEAADQLADAHPENDETDP
jgi:cellobiose-specific phosphotransferase system component IIA